MCEKKEQSKEGPPTILDVIWDICDREGWSPSVILVDISEDGETYNMNCESLESDSPLFLGQCRDESDSPLFLGRCRDVLQRPSQESE